MNTSTSNLQGRTLTPQLFYANMINAIGENASSDATRGYVIGCADSFRTTLVSDGQSVGSNTSASPTRRRGRPAGSKTIATMTDQVNLTAMQTIVVTAIRNNPGGKIADVAKAAGILNAKGAPDGRKAWPVIQSVINKGLVTGTSDSGFFPTNTAGNVAPISRARARRTAASTGRGRRRAAATTTAQAATGTNG